MTTYRLVQIAEDAIKDREPISTRTLEIIVEAVVQALQRAREHA